LQFRCFSFAVPRVGGERKHGTGPGQKPLMMFEIISPWGAPRAWLVIGLLLAAWAGFPGMISGARCTFEKHCGTIRFLRILDTIFNLQLDRNVIYSAAVHHDGITIFVELTLLRSLPFLWQISTTKGQVHRSLSQIIILALL
jgi:hypothetical protein